MPACSDLGDNGGSACVDRGWPAIPRSELSGEERTDSLASIRPVGITVSGPFDTTLTVRLDWSRQQLEPVFRKLHLKHIDIPLLADFPHRLYVFGRHL